MRPQKIGCHFVNSIFKFDFLTENVCILIETKWNLFLQVLLTTSQHQFRYLNAWNNPLPEPMLTKMHLQMLSATCQPFHSVLYVLNLVLLQPEYTGRTCQCHGCWCPGSSRSQGISSHVIDYATYTGPSPLQGKDKITCAISALRNGIKCKSIIPSVSTVKPLV